MLFIGQTLQITVGGFWEIRPIQKAVGRNRCGQALIDKPQSCESAMIASPHAKSSHPTEVDAGTANMGVTMLFWICEQCRINAPIRESCIWWNLGAKSAGIWKTLHRGYEKSILSDALISAATHIFYGRPQSYFLRPPVSWQQFTISLLVPYLFTIQI